MESRKALQSQLLYLTGGQEAVSSSLATRTIEKARNLRNFKVFELFHFAKNFT